MLNITRRPHETVIITTPDGTELEINLLRVVGTNVLMGISAPSNYVIDRYEIWHRKQCEARGIIPQGREPRGPRWEEHLARKAAREEADAAREQAEANGNAP